MVYADANQAGAALEGLSTPAEYRAFSQTLNSAINESVYSSLAELFGEPESIFPFEILVAGGDDALLILPAQKAFPFAIKLARHFEERLNQKLTISIGIAIAHHTHPMHFFRELAEELLKSAKRKAREIKKAKEREESTIDFAILARGDLPVLDLKGMREILYQVNDKMALTYRPYIIEEFEELMGIARRLKVERFPKSQLHSLTSALVKGFTPGHLFYLYQESRGALRKNERLDLTSLLRERGFLTFDFRPWLKREEKYTTVLVDILEILDFVPRNPNEDPN